MRAHAVKGQQHEPQPYQADEQDEAEKRAEQLEAFVAGLEAEAKRRVDLRNLVEKRWLEDLRQYHGRYTEDQQAEFKKNKGSQVFLNLTRPKTNALMARLWDLLFPTDDRNWGVGPTPVPELTEDAEEVLQISDDAKETLEAKRRELGEVESSLAAAEDEQTRAQLEQQAKALSGDMEQAEEVANAAQEAADNLHEALTEAKRRSDLMQEEIDDQLKACSYQAECRDMITDACKIGIGVLKGPVLGDKTKQKWEKKTVTGADGKEQTLHVLTNVKDESTPAAYRVDPWAFFPDPDAARIEDCEGIFERHLMNKVQFRKFAKHPDVDKDAARSILKDGASTGAAPSYLVDLSNITGQKSDAQRNLFVVWEYTGPVEPEDLEELARAADDQETLEVLEGGEIDPLQEMHAKIWFCQGKVLKFALHPLDSGEPIYSVFNPEEDEHSMFGFGMPYLMRDNQSILNAGQRMMLDNAGLSVGPQIVVNKKIVKPEDGNWVLAPRKIWLRDDSEGTDPRERPFEAVDIPSNQAELAAIMEMARKGMDETASLPQIAQGEQGTGVTKTAQGMALLMNSANVVFRRMVKNFDDNVTVPMIRRFYHWNMQFNSKEEIKGDYEVDARGSSVLLVREMMAQNLIMIAQMFGDHPIYGKWLKHDSLLKQIFRAHMIPADEIAKSKREYEQDAEKEAKQPDPAAAAMQAELELKQAEIELRREEIANKREIANQEADTRRYIAERNFDAQMEKLSESMNISREQLNAKLVDAEAEREARERGLAVEVAEKHRTGVSAGGAI
ncbi:hypothetical protein [Leisingera sp. M523]|uniref:portal protein n=1 Tax=Leisingera sp. M523 TaxID=2867013 RepID=UPI0021A36C12|nr:hypothetical protein [Leisingera sp. M523]UWQ30252.1 hypothetical protein K3557_06865 [Leisingera sp. M523]